MLLPPRRALVLVTAVAQIASVPLIGLESSDDPDPVITPAGYAFAIWGAITGLSLVYAVDQALPSRRRARILDDIAPSLAVVFTLFWVWLLAANAGLIWLTVAIFLAMLAALARALAAVLDAAIELPRPTRILATTMLGLYAGWATVAVWANLAAALTSSGVDANAVGWQAVVLVAAAGAGIAGTVRLGSAPAYPAAIIWALVAVAVGAADRGYGVLSAIAAVAAVAEVVVASVVLVRSRRTDVRRREASPA
jgi:hypothetical protein